MCRSVWKAIWHLRQARDPLAWWKHYLRDGFEAVKPYLAPCAGVAGKSVPCPASGIRLQIREKPSGYVAIPTGESAEDAEDLALSWDDVQAWRLDHGALQRGLAEALGLTGGPGRGDGAGVELLGFCDRGGCRKRVYLCHAVGSEAAVRAAADAAGTPEAGCLVFAERHEAAEHVLRARGVGLVALSECVTLGTAGLRGRCTEACRGTQRDMPVVEFKRHFDHRMDELGREFADLKEENETLKQDLASVLGNLAKKVDPEFFQWIFVILGTGSVSAAARALRIPGSTFADRLQDYVARGGVYRMLHSMVGVRRKKVGRRRIERFNELFDQHQGVQAVAEPGVLRELLDGIEALNGTNWKAMREELIEIVKSELPEE